MMQRYAILLGMLLSIVPLVLQAEEPVDTQPSEVGKTLKTHELKLILFRPKQDAVDLSHDQIIELLSNKTESVEVIESVRLSAIQGVESMMQIGRQQSIVVSTASTPQRGEVKSTRDMQVGTMLTATVEEANDKYIVDLRFENSRIVGNTDEPGGATIRNLQTRTSVLLEKGKLKMVGGSSTEDGVYLAISLK